MKKGIVVFVLSVLFWSLPLMSQKRYGRLEDFELNPVPNAWVSAFTNQQFLGRVITNSEGYFEFPMLPSGIYDFTVQLPKDSRVIEKIKIPPYEVITLRVDLEHNDVQSLNAPGLKDVGIDLDRFPWWIIPAADGFDFPFESGERNGFHTSRIFGEQEHQGEDWNRGIGNEDFGIPLYSLADGIVIFAGNLGNGWGKVVRVLHNIGTSEEVHLIESIYAHLDQIEINEGDMLVRGQLLGTMGNVNGKYKAHLHLELRSRPGMSIGGGYGNTDGYIEPSHFIETHRPYLSSSSGSGYHSYERD